MSPAHRTKLIHFGIALPAVVIAFGIRRWWEPARGHELPLLIFLLVIAISAWRRGPRAGGEITLGLALAWLIVEYGEWNQAPLAWFLSYSVFVLAAMVISAASAHPPRKARSDEGGSDDPQPSGTDSATPIPREKGALSARTLRTLEHSAHEIYVFDADTLRFLQVNAGARKNLGYSMNELEKMTPLEISPEMDAARLAEILEPLRNGTEEQVRYETVLRRKDWTAYPVEVRVKMSRSETPFTYVAVAHNISALKQAEEKQQKLLVQQVAQVEAKKADDRLLGLLERSLEALLVVDREGRIVLINTLAETTFGYHREEVLGKTVEMLIPERFRKDHVERRKAFTARLSPQSVGLKLDIFGLHSDGRVIPLEITLSPFPLGGETIVLGVIRDASEKRRAEELRTQLASIVETSNDAILSITLNGKIITWNPGAEKLYGYVANEVIGQPISILVSMDRTDDVLAIIQRIRRGEWLYYHETEHLRKDGKPVDVSLTFSPIRDGAERITSVSMIAHDITERIQAEAALRKARDELEMRVADRTVKLSHANENLKEQIVERQRAEEEVRKLNADLETRVVQLAALNKELESFSYSVSHDLRAPLQSIDGFSQALLEDCGAQLNDEAKEYLHRSRAASQRMAQLIEDLLNLSRVTRREMQRDAIDLSDMIHTVAAELRQRDPERQVIIKIAQGIKADGDARLMRVVLENLLENAWKFTSKRADAVIECGMQIDGSGPAFFVRDNGVGFDMAQSHKMFVAFQRLHARADFEGTGIGLATVQRIIHRHGGRVWAEGAVDQGATFYFTL